MLTDASRSDYITRWSGIAAEGYAEATLSLNAIRELLDSRLSANTILVGHGLENDLKALRIVHDKCVDTVVMYPHRAGLPFRRALRDL